jgi:Ca-activated chloride channel family protein
MFRYRIPAPFLWASAALLVVAACAGAQSVAGEARVAVAHNPKPVLEAVSAGVPSPDLRIDVPLVLVPVHVTTVAGRSVTNLTKQNFALLEDNVEQNIVSFSCEDAPVSIGVLFDLSGSMRDKIDKARAAAVEFLKTANPQDEFFLVLFNDKPRLATGLTRNPDDVRTELAAAKPHGQTALLDAIHLAVAEMKHARYSRKALVIFSDGGDNHSRHSEREIKDEMLEGDVQVFAMGIFEPEGAHLRTREERGGPQLLGELAEQTGGRDFPIRRLEDLPQACARITDELRSEYLLGYSPSNSERDGRFRRVKIVLNPPPDMPRLRVWSRSGYRAPLN